MKLRNSQRRRPVFKAHALTLASLFTASVVSASAFAIPQESDNAKVEVMKGETDVKVKQPAPSVDIDQKDAQVDVNVGKATVDVEYEKPDINIDQQKPQVDIEQAEAEVVVNSAEPEVTVNKAEPNIDIQTSEPEIKIVRKNKDGQLRDGSDIAAISQLTIRELESKTVKNAMGDDVGDISKVVMNKDTRKMSLVLEAGGFFGFGGSKVALPLEEVKLEGNNLVWNENTSVEKLPKYTEAGYTTLSEKNKQIKELVRSN
ncbi:PRC-barrel domain-containing protein [Alteromonas lipotrueiana]|uniref:PRC-barrel domain-containing protein n=1 Tax=Alteromonas lipotrueiana TaxID=2803815 RepID=UPI001C479DF3|nr:PRC-barrel domain-containing protein [Alteromonas lipotrueiana]